MIFRIEKRRKIQIIGNRGLDGFALSRLVKALKAITGREAEFFEAGKFKNIQKLEASNQIVIAVGSPDTNGAIRNLFSWSDKKTALHGGTEGTYLIKVMQTDRRLLVILAGTDRAGTLYAVNEFLDEHLDIDEKNILIGQLDIMRSATLAERVLHTRDYCTNWAGGAEAPLDEDSGRYLKPAESFTENYYRLIDYMSLKKINDLVIWGFLRDAHGGIDAGRNVAEYANERGVRIFAGVGVGAYGGVYHEGENPFNLERFLLDNPQYRAVKLRKMKTGVEAISPEGIACSSRPEIMDWHRTALAWLVEEVPELGGISFRTSDSALCGCDGCRDRFPGGIEGVFENMAALLGPVINYVKEKRPDIKIFAECPVVDFTEQEFFRPLARLPEGTCFIWNMDADRWQELGPTLSGNFAAGLPGRKNILHITVSGENGRSRPLHEFLHDISTKAREAGFIGLSLCGEVSPLNVSNEINYLAFADFTFPEGTTLEQFYEGTIAPLVGGIEPLKKYLSFLKDFRDIDRKKTLSEIESIKSNFTGSVARRWDWLYNYIDLDGQLEI